MNSNSRVIGMDDPLPYGKFKGSTPREVFEEKPSYLRWMAENTDIDFSQDVLDGIKNWEMGIYQSA